LHLGEVDLTSALRSLIPSLDSAVLEVLAGTESGLSASQIARLSARGTRAGQGVVLDRLVQHGLVLAERANTGYLFRLNRAHVLTPAVLAAVGARREILDRLTIAAAALTPAPISAALYGSFVRRQAGPDSDLNLLLVLDDALDRHADAWQSQLEELERQVLDWTGNRLGVLQLSHRQLADAVTAGQPLVRSLREEAVTLHGEDIQALLETTMTGGRW
jgi:predicted nucleotidyltransferase